MVFFAKVVNYFGHGNERTDFPGGVWSWNVLSVKLGNYRVKITQDKDIIANKIQAKGCVHTTDVEVYGVKKFGEGERVVRDLCSLLSLASFSQVVPFHYSYDDTGRSLNILAEAIYFRPLIEIKEGNAMKHYLEKTWIPFRKRKRTRKLPEVIEMLTVAELPAQPLEVKLAQMFIVLENLKGTYARAKKIPFHKGFYRQVNSPPKANLARERRLGFEALLQMMFKDVQMKPSTKRIVKLRNEIIHFGLSRKPYESLRKNYDYCHDIVREYLLRFLKYEGNYKLYSHACRSIRKI